MISNNSPSFMKQAFAQLEQERGLPAGTLTGMYGIESNFGQTKDRRGSQFKGPFQLGRTVQRQYGVNNPSDLMMSARGAADYARDNFNYLKNKLGRDPTAADLYLAHQQGPYGAFNLLSNPDIPAGSLTNPRFISANNGDPRAPASAFTQMFGEKFNKALTEAPTEGPLPYAGPQESPTKASPGLNAMETAMGPAQSLPKESTVYPSSSPSGWETAGNIGNGLMVAGAALMARDNPEGARVLLSGLRSNQSDNDWQTSIDTDTGQAVQINKKTGATRVIPLEGFKVKPKEETKDVQNYKFWQSMPPGPEKDAFGKANKFVEEDVSPALTEDTMARLLKTELSGGKLGPNELGVGKQRSANAAAYQEYKTAKAKELDIPPEDFVKAQTDVRFRNKVADRIALVELNTRMAGNRIAAAGDNLLKAAQAYPRLDIRFLQSIKEKWDEQTNDPNLAQFKVAVDAFAQDYAQALNPSKTQVTVDDIKHARDRIITSMNDASLAAVVNRVQAEVRGLHDNVAKTHEQFFGRPPTLIEPASNTTPSPITNTGSKSGLPEGAKQAPDGNYYVQKDGKWFKVVPKK